ncbi:nuclear transport factor 2 family protein [Streptomyces sp. NBC_01304]|uniref:nuclear transport factor 2 family protein n=1 Tax=Streptomyces sp. NBC_01304 TaxID=2903818 RepID=UPI002E151B10|nr:nuclear transport factor 2 family protein [Streptomyces sp. NBC_01304]
MTNLPASRTALLRQMYEAFNAQDLDALIPAALAPDVNWPNLLDHTRAHGHEEVRAYWARQFAVTHPLVRLEALRPDPDGHRIIATVLPGLRDESGDHWSESPVEHVYTFGDDGKVRRMDVRTP